MQRFLPRFPWALTMALVGPLTVCPIVLLPEEVLARSVSPSSQGPSSQKRATPKGPKPKIDRLTVFLPPSGKKGAPQSTASTATRDRQSCLIGGDPLKLTWPEVQSSRPQFSLYRSNTASRQAVLALRGPGFYERQVVSLPPEPGWVTLAWPSQSPPLAIGQPYEWFVVVVCGDSPEPDDPTFSGGFDPKTRSIGPIP